VAAVRYPRGVGIGANIAQKMQALPIGKAEIKRETSKTNKNEKVAILSFGSMLKQSLAAAESLDATLVNMRFVKPIDHAMIAQMAETHGVIVTVEENSLMGGAGAAVLESLQQYENSYPQKNMQLKTLCLGLPDTFIEHGVHETMLAECGLDQDGIVRAIQKILK
jgi:1-deoxy-D-xylulose-5-phosphate synthase